MKQTRPRILAELEREVRQRCGFGCVLCGCPIYQIHHIEGWAATQEHSPEDLTLLCANHHEEEKKGLIPKKRIREADADPINRRRGTSGALALGGFMGDSCTFIVGDFRFENVGPTPFFTAIMIDGCPVLGFRFDDGHPDLHILLMNEYNEPILVVRDGYLVLSTQSWDITFQGSVLTVREGKGQIRLQVGFEPPSKVHVRQGFLLQNGIAVAISDHGLECLNTGARWTACEARTSGVGIALGPHPPGVCVGWSLPKIPRYKGLSFKKRPAR